VVAAVPVIFAFAIGAAPAARFDVIRFVLKRKPKAPPLARHYRLNARQEDVPWLY
jgi:hypothetical protein